MLFPVVALHEFGMCKKSLPVTVFLVLQYFVDCCVSSFEHWLVLFNQLLIDLKVVILLLKNRFVSPR